MKTLVAALILVCCFVATANAQIYVNLYGNYGYYGYPQARPYFKNTMTDPLYGYRPQYRIYDVQNRFDYEKGRWPTRSYFVPHR